MIKHVVNGEALCLRLSNVMGDKYHLTLDEIKEFLEHFNWENLRTQELETIKYKFKNREILFVVSYDEIIFIDELDSKFYY